MKKFFAAIFLGVVGLSLVVADAEAKRFGGGRSLGMQRQAAPAKPATPPAGNAQQATPGANPAAPAATPKRNWMGPLAGLAAGIGLAALFSHLGLGAGLANFAMILLIAFAAIVVLKLLFKRRESATNEPVQFAGVGGPNLSPTPELGITPPGAPVPGMGSGLGGGTANIPADFDVEGFIRVAKVQFVRMQTAHDACNLDDIREFTTPEMFAEIKLDIDERHGAVQHTEVISVEAEVLEVVSEPTRHIASVRYQGRVREAKDAPESSFDEVWNLVKPTQGGGWILAGVQQLN